MTEQEKEQILRKMKNREQGDVASNDDDLVRSEKDMKKGIEYPEMVAKLAEIYEAGQTYFVAWGTEDYKVLNTGCERHKIENPVQYEDYLDLAEAYKLWKGDELTTGLKRATEEQEVDTAGLWHTAYDDAANTGKLLVRMLEKGWTPELYFEQKAAYDAEKAERRLHGR